MAGILFILFLAAFVLLFIGFFNPKTSLFWYKKERTKKLSAAVYSIAMVIFLILFISALPDIYTVPAKKETMKTGATHTQEAATINASNDHPVIIKSVDEFRNRFNMMQKEMKSDLYISDNIELKDGGIGQSFQYNLNEYIGLLADVDRNNGGVIDVVMMAAGGDGSAESGLNIISTMGGLINAADPSLSPKGRGDLLKRLGVLEMKAEYLEKGIFKDIIQNNIKYSFSATKAMGVTFSIGHP